ncbi:hypothetical protein phiYY_sS2 [Pseudomonas phage phiYY]|uniref:Uncharacterized protein n=1 Tax=Pseudomonas phage phiYY TaxID=1852644 RepID=A0A1W2KDR5_9VIRU|nr:hypothetical protein phiYY_sS2 [Pseudomonas phage phiYY]ANM47314.1 hypothetical protein phiYY_sS2 [Pseudomonas phage phiYY]
MRTISAGPRDSLVLTIEPSGITMHTSPSPWHLASRVISRVTTSVL